MKYNFSSKGNRNSSNRSFQTPKNGNLGRVDRDIIEYIDHNYFKNLSKVEFAPLDRRLIDQLNRMLDEPGTLDEILKSVFTVSRKLCGCDRIGLAFLEDNGKKLKCYSVETNYERIFLNKGYSSMLRDSSLFSVIASNHIRIIHDLEKYLKINPGSRPTEMLVREGIRSSLTCPLIMNGKVIGIIFRNSLQPNAFGNRQIRFHMHFSEKLNAVLEKAYMQEQKEIINRGYVEMLGFVSHELKNPISTMVMKAKLLQEGYHGELNVQQKNEIQKLIGKGEYLLQLVRDYLDMARLEQHQLKLDKKSDVNFMMAIFDPSMDILTIQLEEKNMQLSQWITPENLTVECDPYLMKIVMINLISNACKYGDKGSEIRVRVEKLEKAFTVSVWNEGPGFPPDLHSQLFKKFSRLQTPDLANKKGTGVGLYNVNRIIQLHGGLINARSTPGEWAEFFFIIPQPLDQDAQDWNRHDLPKNFADLNIF